MENIFPLKECVEIEEIYGSKRPNSHPPVRAKTFRMENAAPKGGEMYRTRAVEWFDREAVSQEERIGLEDVVVRLGERRYREIRNDIVDRYANGARPLVLRGVLDIDADFGTLMQMFLFLETWGLINHKDLLGMHAEGVEPCVESPETRTAEMDVKECLSRPECVCGEHAEFFTRMLVLRCSACFNSGEYPADVSQADFFPLSEMLMKNMWSRLEELLLLEGIHRFGDQWDLVSQHVQTKTRNQCIFHFVRMPIMENTLSKADFGAGLPFETAENPVMCLVAFVCGIVHPAVAVECARTAIKSIGDSAQDAVVDRMMDAARTKAEEQLGIERAKIERLERVLCEAVSNKIRMKVETYKELHSSVDRIRDELIGLRQSLVDELTQDDSSEEG